ncbi:hypothetical protein DFS33DRAFT_1278488 [Desarmillaria ectypa]|nr:hypothetical protein DFS33DRAFT_1278488 [Desarmillaria ectypa]
MPQQNTTSPSSRRVSKFTSLSTPNVLLPSSAKWKRVTKRDCEAAWTLTEKKGVAATRTLGCFKTISVVLNYSSAFQKPSYDKDQLSAFFRLWNSAHVDKDVDPRNIQPSSEKQIVKNLVTRSGPHGRARTEGISVYTDDRQNGAQSLSRPLYMMRLGGSLRNKLEPKIELNTYAPQNIVWHDYQICILSIGVKLIFVSNVRVNGSTVSRVVNAAMLWLWGLDRDLA